MKRLRIFTIVLLFVALGCEEKVFVLTTSERLKQRLDRFAESKPDLAISAAIIKNGELSTAVSGQSFDNSSFDDKRIFLAASTTKMFAAALTVKYTDENQISLDTKISNFLQLDDRFSDGITIRNLLNHSSGLEDYLTDEYLAAVINNPQHIFTPAELMYFVPETTTLPGNGFFYSNTNYLLLGMLLEEWSGESLNVLLRNEIFDAVGSPNTSLYPFEPVQGTMEHLWTDVDGDGVIDDLTALGFTPESLLSGAWASGGILSTPTDMVTFLKELFEGDILNDNQLQALQQFTEIIPDQYSYGMGLQKINYNQEAWIGHDGSLIHYTMAFYHPATGSCVAIMANQDGFDYEALMLEVIDIFS
jgi:D-alanyl-D-alanine carboxypeptidase